MKFLTSAAFISLLGLAASAPAASLAPPETGDNVTQGPVPTIIKPTLTRISIPTLSTTTKKPIPTSSVPDTISTSTTTTSSGGTVTSAAPGKYPSIVFTPADSPPLVPLFDTTNADPAVIKALKTIPFPRTMLSTLAHAEGLFVPLMGVLGSSFDGTKRNLAIDDWLMIVCRTGILLDAQYVFDNNVHGLTIVGWDFNKINSLNMTHADIVAGQGPWTHRQRILLRIIDEQIDRRSNDLQTIEEALTILTIPELVESLIMIGTYTTFSGVARGLRVAQDSTMPGLDGIIRKIITSNYRIFNQG
ncbi:hypothetical protein B0H63DRAFT_565056 [Podospora didyma]|uniref:Uncharacterized protein n=1 Tax=Podospora didyma TaxID=330526 RepID=A0AAE0K2Q7_9PEZI|nr:hypothetical protein B0H63DRAFT_565056 [Podospora didyma]